MLVPRDIKYAACRNHFKQNYSEHGSIQIRTFLLQVIKVKWEGYIVQYHHGTYN